MTVPCTYALGIGVVSVDAMSAQSVCTYLWVQLAHGRVHGLISVQLCMPTGMTEMSA
jgi:hypothetical protein